MYKKITLELPVLDGLNPSLESTLIKGMEELGELAQLIGRGRCMSGENIKEDPDLQKNISLELLDVIQVCITFIGVMQRSNPDFSIDDMLEEHVNKLLRKGYLYLKE